MSCAFVHTRVVRKVLRQSAFCQKESTEFKTTYIAIKCYIIIWDVGLNCLTAALKGYDQVAAF